MNNMHPVRLGQGGDPRLINEQQGYVQLAKGSMGMSPNENMYIINSRINRNLVKVSNFEAGQREDVVQSNNKKIKMAEQNRATFNAAQENTKLQNQAKMYNQIGNRHLRQSSMQYGGQMAATEQEHSKQHNSRVTGGGKKIETFDSMAAQPNFATGGVTSTSIHHENNGRSLSKSLPGHHSSSQCMRTQSQEYLRQAQDGKHKNQLSTFKQNKLYQNNNQNVGRGVMSVGPGIAHNNGVMLDIHRTQKGLAGVTTDLFGDANRQQMQGTSTAKPKQINVSNQRHAYVHKLINQHTDHLYQYNTPQQSKHPFIPSPGKFFHKGGTQMEQQRKLGTQPSKTNLVVGDSKWQQSPHFSQHKYVPSAVQQLNGGNSIQISYPHHKNVSAFKLDAEHPMDQLGGQGYGMIDQNTYFTSDSQNRQIRVITKKQMKQHAYTNDPMLNQQIISSNPNGTTSIAKQQYQSKSVKPSPIGIQYRQVGDEGKPVVEDQKLDLLRQLASGAKGLHTFIADHNLDENRRVQTKYKYVGHHQKAQAKAQETISPLQQKGIGTMGKYRQFSPTGRDGSLPKSSVGQHQQANGSGLDYLTNIANIAQSSPQYVLDKNIIKAEIVNQANMAARTAQHQQPYLHQLQQPQIDAEQKFNQLVYENLMLGSQLSAPNNIQNNAPQDLQRYDQQEKLIKAFRQVVQTGNVDQLSGMEMLQQWQMLYGQNNPETLLNKSRLQGQKQAQNHPRLHSTDGAAASSVLSSHNESLMQNIKISQLNQISAVLDQQTEKLIAHTQQLMNGGAPLNYIPGSDLMRAYQAEGMTISQEKPGARYRSSYSGIHHKHYDRQRMLDFYSSIRMGDLDDQAKSRSQAIKQAPPLDPNKLRFSVVMENNARLIKIAMARRKDFWLETTVNDPHFHFKWSPRSYGMKFDIVGKDIAPEVHPCQKQIVNHFEGHACVSEKSKLFLNLTRYASNKLNENVFDFLPLTFFVECDLSKQKQFSKSMVQFMNAFYALDDIKKRTQKFYEKLDSEEAPAPIESAAVEVPDPVEGENAEQTQTKVPKTIKEQLFDDNFIFKHFYQNKILLIRQHKKEEREEKEAFFEAMGVSSLIQNAQATQVRTNKSVTSPTPNSSKFQGQVNVKASTEINVLESSENIPTSDQKSPTIPLNQALQRQNQNKILKKYFHRQSMPFCHYSGHNLWILKATKLNQGQGIHVCNSLPQVKNLIQRYCEGFPKKQSENFTYEREINNRKNQGNEVEVGAIQLNNNNGRQSHVEQSKTQRNRASRQSATKANRLGLLKSKNKSHLDVGNDKSADLDNQVLKPDISPHRRTEDEDGNIGQELELEQDSVHIPESRNTVGGELSTNSKLIKSESTKKILPSTTGTHTSPKSSSVTRQKHQGQTAGGTDGRDAEDKYSDNGGSVQKVQRVIHDSPTPRREARDLSKNRDKIKHLSSTMPEVTQGGQNNLIQQQQQQRPANQFEAKYKHNSFIIQKYIERPLLIDQRKFDIRVWVFLDHKGNAYICRPGYLRTSSYKFELDPDDPDNRFVHLTNIAVQKYTKKFGAHEDGNILNYEQFEEYVHKTYPNRNFSLEHDLVFKIRQQIARTLFATRKLMDYNKRANQSYQNSNFFELFGYDFMVDEDFNVWLIECNTNPSLAESAKYLEQLIPRMIEDMIKLTIDEEYMYYYKQIIQVNKQLIAQTDDHSELPTDLADQSCLDRLLSIKSPHLPGYADDENVWEKMLNLHNRAQRKEAKQKYNVPIEINSKYAFNIKNRDFKIKRYINYRAQLEQVMNQAANGQAAGGQGGKNPQPGTKGGGQDATTDKPVLEQNQGQIAR